MNLSKVLWVKTGWSDYYRGGPVDGAFAWLENQRGGAKEGRGHEAFNFMPGPDGTYYGYTPPNPGDAVPSSKSPGGWTVIFLAKQHKKTGIHVVGWYEDATLHGEYLPRSPAAAAAGEPDFGYTITSRSAWFVPPEQRNDPFSHISVGQAKYSYLRAPGEKPTKNKIAVLDILQRRIKALHGVAVKNPNPLNAPDPEDEVGDALGFGTPEHRKAVEMAAEAAVVSYYKKKQFRSKRVANENLGYDYVFKKKGVILHVEVKGTAASVPGFFITRRELKGADDAAWRLAMVTDALSAHPITTVMTGPEMKRAFNLDPLVYECRPKTGRKAI